jgi:hypothetical protein
MTARTALTGMHLSRPRTSRTRGTRGTSDLRNPVRMRPAPAAAKSTMSTRRAGLGRIGPMLVPRSRK